MWLKPLANKIYVHYATGEKNTLYNSNYTRSVNFRPFATQRPITEEVEAVRAEIYARKNTN
jgi:hypothetical protein